MARCLRQLSQNLVFEAVLIVKQIKNLRETKKHFILIRKNTESTFSLKNVYFWTKKAQTSATFGRLSHIFLQI